MTFDECVNVAIGTLVATLYNFVVLSQGRATMEKSPASTMSYPGRLELEIGVPLIASQHLMSSDVKETNWEPSSEDLTESTQQADGCSETPIKGSHCARPPRSQHELYVISLQCLSYRDCCVGAKTSAE